MPPPPFPQGFGHGQGRGAEGENRFGIAVIGDGAMTGGMAYEALNHGQDPTKLIVILNDNNMSIDPPTGALLIVHPFPRCDL